MLRNYRKSVPFCLMRQGLDMSLNYSLHCSIIRAQGFRIFQLELPEKWREWREQENFGELDQDIAEQLKPHGLLGRLFQTIGDYQTTEHILSLRRAPDDEDGIWHDDGSRNFAFSLGLNLRPDQIQGGELSLRKKGSLQSQKFSPLAWGEMVVFLTGVWGYEHQVSKVELGERLIAAGWLS